MILQKQVIDTIFVISKDELPYARVLEDFENAEYIYILTYNISQNEERLISKLKDCDDAEICIVTNIPSRWEVYYNEKYAERARKNIRLYKSKLNLRHTDLSVYFNFSNHAKIIMTDNIFYVGSANFSEDSANNFESGFISTDTAFINYLRDDVFPWIIDSSVELKTDDDLILIDLGLSNAIASFQNLYEEINYKFYTYSGHSTTSDRLYYRGESILFSSDDIDDIKIRLDKYTELLSRTNMLFSLLIFREMDIENLDKLVTRFEDIKEEIEDLFESALIELASFSEERIKDDYLEDHYAEADEENLDYYAQKAVELALLLHEKLADEYKIEVDKLLELLEEVKSIAETVLTRFKRLPVNLIKIDNTVPNGK